jgi:1,4-dihydroxy-2-naphthoyl-CoA hydrolase
MSDPVEDPAGSAVVDPAVLLALMPFAATIGIELVSAAPAEAVGRLPWAPQRCTSGGVLHGGALMALADTVGAVVAFLNLPPGARTSTIESKTNFLRAVRDGAVRAIGRPLHVGRTVIVVQVELFDDADRRVAHVTASQAVLT